MPQIFQRATARRDLVTHFVYLAENAGVATADSFIAQAEASYALLAANPAIGTPLSVRSPLLQGVRKWRVTDFESFLIFYLPRSDGMTVIRVLHATQDWWRLLEVK